jgi:hypothetical protein
MRYLNLLVIAALILAASLVYKIKFDSTLQAEQVAKMRGELRRERNAIASLRAEWAKLDQPARIQGLALRHLKLVPVKSSQFVAIDKWPMRPPPAPAGEDAISALIAPSKPETTGSVPPAPRR